MPEVTVPIFDAGVNEANLDIAHVTKRIEIAHTENAIQTAFREVSDALVARANLDDEIGADAALVAAKQKRYDIAGARYQNGVDNYLSVLTAQQDLNRAQQSLVEARFLRLANLVTLYQALGGGWQEFSPPTQTPRLPQPANRRLKGHPLLVFGPHRPVKNPPALSSSTRARGTPIGPPLRQSVSKLACPLRDRPWFRCGSAPAPDRPGRPASWPRT